MIVFHGSTDVVKNPDVNHSYRPLDFGKGFYITTVEKQAKKWSRRKAELANKKNGIINCYTMSENWNDFRVKTFDDDLNEWIDFVCACRDGSLDYKKYDIIFGKVADDKVFRVVDMFHQGIWDKERALKEIKVYDTYDQIAFINQEAIDSLLEFDSYYEV